MSPTNSTKQEFIYNQDCEFYRYQDKLRWGRFQTAATIEAGILYVIFTFTTLNDYTRQIFLLVGLLLIIMVSTLAIKDGSDSERHIKRIRNYEKGVALPNSSWPKILRGKSIMIAAIAILNILNISLLIIYW